jgi:ribosomal protein S18 acetylase RimI-like enzyme
VRVRAARRDDFEAVTRLLEELGRPTVAADTEADSHAVYDEQVVDPDSHHLVAEEEDDGAIVGFCSLHFRARLNWPTPEAWIPDLIVSDASRRRGIGLALLEEAQRRARERGCHALTLESGYNRAEAHHLYRTFRMRDSGKQFVKDLRGRA